MTSEPNIVVVSALAAQRLEGLLERLSQDTFPGKADLENELLRAGVVPPEDVPPTVVPMNSTVRFKVPAGTSRQPLPLNWMCEALVQLSPPPPV